MRDQRGGRRQENPGSGQDIEGQDCCTKKKLKQYFLNWNLILLASGMYAVAVDTLFFFVLVTKEDEKRLLFQKTLYFVAIGLRSVADLISLANIILEFRTPYIDKDKAKRTQTQVLVEDTWLIAKRYLRSYFLIDVLAILPLPQVLFPIFIIREMGRSKYSGKRKFLNALVCLQYVPTALRIYRSWEKFKQTNKELLDQNIVLFKSVFNLIIYILAAQVLGAFWYFFAVDQEMACWQIAIEKPIGCIQSSFSYDSSLRNFTIMNETQNTISYDFGIFCEAIQLGILASTDIPRKMVYCLWWGLRNLSSFGQNLKTSARFWETFFAVSISIFGLLLFLYFLGNLQMYMQVKKSIQLRQQLKIRVPKTKNPGIKNRIAKIKEYWFSRAKELMMEVLRKAASNTEEAGVGSTPWKVQINHRQPGQGDSRSTTLASSEGLSKYFPAILNGKRKRRE